jgi:hypothetical protein
VDKDQHFCVDRSSLVGSCAAQLVGAPEKSGHYFTIWAPRQTGKTWLMRETRSRLASQWGDRFAVGTMSMQGVLLEDSDPVDRFLREVPLLLSETFGFDLGQPPADWSEFRSLFHADAGRFERPVILFIDEFDALPRHLIDRLVTLFRDMYLKRDAYALHGLALIGVRAVLGVESQRGSPFNVQRSLHVPNLTEDEVGELFRQYQEESGQKVAQEVVGSLYLATRGQPGLVGWFGELLTEKYNPGAGATIDPAVWRGVYRAGLSREWNNTVLNLVKKAQGEYLPHVVELFGRADVAFKLDAAWCNYLYFNGIIDAETAADAQGEDADVCRFSSPFVQERLYNALADELVGDRTPILALEPLDDLADVFPGDSLNLPGLLDRYRAYLQRLTAKGIDPWQKQPRRADLRLTEAVGHFHLYAWLQQAIGRRCVVSPEFPTGNGKVDLHLLCGAARGVIEVKSFVDQYELARSREQAARYAAGCGLDSVTMALFVPTVDQEVLAKLSGQAAVDGVHVTVVAIGWETG